MAVIGQILVQFVFRVTFGMALAMGITPARLVTSGYFRVHLWVLMGLNTLAALAVYSAQGSQALLWAWEIRLSLAIVLAVLSYGGAVLWLYEQSGLGTKLLWAISGLGLVAATAALPTVKLTTPTAVTLAGLDFVTSGLLMGALLAAMLLGHWYLNTPTMQLMPLERLIRLVLVAAVLRALVAGAGLGMQVDAILGGSRSLITAAFLGFRWVAGIIGPLVLAQMARQTLKIPNTQSATGILYAGVILVFLGELTSQLLSVDSKFPV